MKIFKQRNITMIKVKDLKKKLDKLDPETKIVNSFLTKKAIVVYHDIINFREVKIKKHNEKNYYIESKSGEIAYSID